MGDGASAMRRTPTKIDALSHERMAHIACSYSHTVALTGMPFFCFELINL